MVFVHSSHWGLLQAVSTTVPPHLVQSDLAVEFEEDVSCLVLLPY